MDESKMAQTAATEGAKLQTDTLNKAAAVPVAVPYVVMAPKIEDTENTKKMKDSFSFFGPATFVYAVFYAFCMYKNGAGITFPFFMAGSLLYLYLCLSRLGISLKRGSLFYMIGMVLLGVSTFCTDDWRIINLNKTVIFFLMMSLLLKQFYNTSKWKLGKYLTAICQLVVLSLGEIVRPFSDGKRYLKNRKGKKDKRVWYGLLGLVIAIPLFFMMLGLLSSADAVFRQLTNNFLEYIEPGNIFNMVFRILFLFFFSYILLAYLCCNAIKEEVKDRRSAEPVIAIIITGLLSLLYLVFSGIQIIYLFLGKMELPSGYTYAMYAREGFFQLLAVSVINLIIVLLSMKYFRESRVLKGILTIMSLCTFIMIASSALRMIMYIRYYYMTFLRIFVLWALAALFLLFIGVLANIYRERFPLFRYGLTVVTVLYVALSFIHPDYIIAKVNVANAPWVVYEEMEDLEKRKPAPGDFFQSENPYHDFRYLSTLSADAAPVIIPYLKQLGYDMELFYEDNIRAAVSDREKESGRMLNYPYRIYGFGYLYLERMQERTQNLSWRTFNVSRYVALKSIEKYTNKLINRKAL